MAIGQKKQKQTPEVVGKLEQAFCIGSTVSEACFYAGIADSTYYQWCSDDQELSEQFSRLRQTPVLKARLAIYNNLDNPSVAKWYLERKAAAEFAPRSLGHIEVSVDVEETAGEFMKRKGFSFKEAQRVVELILDEGMGEIDAAQAVLEDRCSIR